jgi:hypothetical protein
LLRKYERELRKLRAELTRRNKELVDKRHLLEVRTVRLCSPSLLASCALTLTIPAETNTLSVTGRGAEAPRGG